MALSEASSPDFTNPSLSHSAHLPTWLIGESNKGLGGGGLCILPCSSESKLPTEVRFRLVFLSPAVAQSCLHPGRRACLFWVQHKAVPFSIVRTLFSIAALSLGKVIFGGSICLTLTRISQWVQNVGGKARLSFLCSWNRDKACSQGVSGPQPWPSNAAKNSYGLQRIA